MKKLKKNIKKDYTSMIIPLYNEERRLDYSFNIIEILLRKKEKIFKEIIFVDDGSKDKSKDKILEFLKKNKKKKFFTKLKLISYLKNRGKGFAIKKGILSSTSDWILTCDLDMSVLPDQYLIWRRKKLIKDTYCAYVSSRTHEKSKVKSKITRKILGNILSLILFLLFNLKISDTQCGFKIYHKNYVKRVFKRMKTKRYAYDVELMLILKSIGIKIKEMPVNWTHHSGSKINIIIDSFIMILDLFRIRLRIGLND